jgi:hypothetical protein
MAPVSDAGPGIQSLEQPPTQLTLIQALLVIALTFSRARNGGVQNRLIKKRFFIGIAESQFAD